VTNQTPIVAANFSPFRLVLRDQEADWNADLELINDRSYDYVKLHRASTFIDVGIAPWSLVVGYDGTLAIPAKPELREPDVAIHIFNSFLCDLLLGGLYCEAVSPDELRIGTISSDSYMRMHSGAQGPIAQFHESIKTKIAGPLDTIRLLEPPKVRVRELTACFHKGSTRRSKLGSISPETIIYGTTFFTKNQRAESLLHLWTSTEQLIETIWKSEVLEQPIIDGASKKRRKDFLSDNRTWTASSKLEVLYQKRLIPDDTYLLLDRTRRSRNAFAHSGKKPSDEEVTAALTVFFELCSLLISGFSETGELKEVEKMIKERKGKYLEWERTREPIDGVSHWLPIPPIPGDENWGDEPYEIIEELQLKDMSGEA